MAGRTSFPTCRIVAIVVAMLVAVAEVGGEVTTPEAWSCSPARASQVSASYARKVADVLDAMELDVRAHAATWELVYRTVGGEEKGEEEEVMGSAGCIPSDDVRTRDDCSDCIAAARRHLRRLCPDNARGSVFLRGCTLMFARVERSGPRADDWEERAVDDENEDVGRASSLMAAA